MRKIGFAWMLLYYFVATPVWAQEVQQCGKEDGCAAYCNKNGEKWITTYLDEDGNATIKNHLTGTTIYACEKNAQRLCAGLLSDVVPIWLYKCNEKVSLISQKGKILEMQEFDKYSWYAKKLTSDDGEIYRFTFSIEDMSYIFFINKDFSEFQLKKTIPYYLLQDLTSQIYIATKEGKYGIVNLDGLVFLPFEYAKIEPVEKEETKHLYIQKYGKYGVFYLRNENEGKKLLDTIYDEIRYAAGKYIVKESGKYKIYSISLGKFETEVEFEDVSFLNGEFFAVKLDGKYGVYDSNQKKLVVPAEYDEIKAGEEPSGNTFIVSRNGKSGLYRLKADKKGELIVPLEFDSIRPIGGSEYFIVSQKGSQGIYGVRENRMVLPAAYEDIRDTELNRYYKIPIGDYYLLVKSRKKWGLIQLGENAVTLVSTAENKDIWVFRKNLNIVKEALTVIGSRCLILPEEKRNECSKNIDEYIERYEKEGPEEVFKEVFILRSISAELLAKEAAFFAFEKNGKYRFSRFGKPSEVSGEYDGFQVFDASAQFNADVFVRVQDKGKYGMLVFPVLTDDTDPETVKKGFRVLLNPEYQQIHPYYFVEKGSSEKIEDQAAYAPVYFKAMKDGKWGILDEKGRLLVPFSFDGIEKFVVQNGVAAVSPGNHEWRLFVAGKGIAARTCRKISILKYDSQTGEVAYRCMSATLEWENFSAQGPAVAETTEAASKTPLLSRSGSEENPVVLEMVELSERRGVSVIPSAASWQSSSSSSGASSGNLPPWENMDFWVFDKDPHRVGADHYSRLMSDALSLKPGVNFLRTHPAGAVPLLMGPGLSPRIYVDGVPLAASILRPSVNTQVNLFDPYWFDRMELVHGYSPVMFGSTAVNGVIHLVPRPGYSDSEEKKMVVGSGYRSVDSSLSGFTWLSFRDDSGALMFGLSGWRSGDLKGGEGGGTQADTDFKSWGGYLNLTLAGRPGSNVSYWFWDASLLWGKMPRANRPFVYEPWHRVQYDDVESLIFWSKVGAGLPKANLHVLGQAGVQFYVEKQSDLSAGAGAPAGYEQARDDLGMVSPTFDVKAKWVGSRRFQAYAGLLGQYSTVEPKSFVRGAIDWVPTDPSVAKDAKYGETSLYGMLVYQWLQGSRWRGDWRLGSRMENIAVDAGSVQYDMQSASLSSSISLSHPNFSVSLCGASGSRAPTLYESAFTGHSGSLFHGSNPDLKPERIDTVEMQGVYHAGRLNVSGRLFRGRIADPIVLRNSGSTYEGLIHTISVNGDDDSTYAGGFASVRYGLGRVFELWGQVSRLSAKYEGDESVFLVAGTDFPLNGAMGFRMKPVGDDDDDDIRFFGDSYIVWSGTGKNYDSETYGCTGDGGSLCWYTLNVRAGIKGENFALYATFENILNENYKPYGWSYYAPGFSVFLNLVYED